MGVVVGALFTSGVFAQRDTEIAYGDQVEGSITDATAGADYTFTAADGDIVVIQVQPSADAGAFGAEVRVLAANGNVVADSNAMTVFGRTGQIIAAELTDAGSYTINVYDAEGGFNLLLLQALPLEAGQALSGTASPPADSSQANYGAAYSVISTDDFTVSYNQTGGIFRPSLVAYSMREGGNLFPVAAVLNIESADSPSRWLGGGIRMAGSRDINIFLVGSLELQFGSPDASLTEATFEVSLGD
jgi:hypothetical protein